jgi:uncharacterized protein (TIGR03435 family)
MQKIILACFLMAGHFSFSQPLQIGDVVPANIKLTILNSDRTIQISELRNKIVLVECWATWCGPCLSALQKFEKLQKQFGERLVVLAVSGESPERLRRFIENKRPGVQVIADTAGIISRLFPHRIIPHTVLIGKDGKICAITDAKNIIGDVIDKVWAGQAIRLPVKQDRTDFNLAAYFNADTTHQQMFIMQPAVSDVGTFTKSYPNTNFADRRITIVNGTRSLLFRYAYDKNHLRTINLYEDEKEYKELEKFCIDAWVAEKSKTRLRNFLQKQFNNRFIDVEAKIEKRLMKVYVLKANDSALQKLQKTKEHNEDYAAGGGFFDGKGVRIEKLAEYLEDFGIVQKPVIDKTGLPDHYSIYFEWEPEQRSSLFNALQRLGLFLEEGEELIDILIIKKI